MVREFSIYATKEISTNKKIDIADTISHFPSVEPYCLTKVANTIVLKGGHWCPICENDAWNHAEIAKHNPFFSQVWTPIHGDIDFLFIKKDKVNLDE